MCFIEWGSPVLVISLTYKWILENNNYNTKKLRKIKEILEFNQVFQLD